MKIPVLGDLMTEINRLFVAGAKLAIGDPRLAKLIPVLEKMGERAPIFSKLAADTSELVSAAPEDTGRQLLALGTLLYSILYTQGDTSATGEYAALEAIPGALALAEARTDINYGRMRPLLEALTTQKSGRLEVIQAAYRDGLFCDLRTHSPAVRALDDRYGEIVTFVEQQVIPAIGSRAIPHLLSQYSPNGDKGAGRRLCLLGRLGYTGAEQLARQALDNNDASVHVWVAAIEILGQSCENEPILLGLAKDKKKELREAALIALVKLDSTQGKKMLEEAFCGKGYKASLAAMAYCRDKEIKLIALDLVQKLEAEVLSGGGEKKEQAARCERFLECAGTLTGLPEASFTDYMQHVLTAHGLRKAGGMGNWALQSLYNQYLNQLNRLPYPESASILKDLAADKELSKFYAFTVHLWFLKAAQTYTPREMYKEFYRYYIANQLDADVFEQAYPEDLQQQLEERWIDEWFKSKNAKFKMLAIRLCDPSNRRQIKGLCALLRQEGEQMKNAKSSYRLPHISALLDKMLQCGVDLKKEISPLEAQRLLSGRGSALSQPVQDALTTIASPN